MVPSRKELADGNKMQISPCFPRGYLQLRANACAEHGGMTEFWNVNLRQVHASVHVHEKMRCVCV